MRSGPIRFVGGPWHNRVVNVHWLSQIRIPIVSPDRRAIYAAVGIVVRQEFELATYERHCGRTPAGTEFHEYWLAGLAPFWNAMQTAFDIMSNNWDAQRYSTMDPARG